MSKISSIHAREILDSRGNPTLETTVVCDDGTFGTASVPSGASTGSHEVLELRDNDPKRFHGKGVLNAIHNVETDISDLLKGKNPSNQKVIDDAMNACDGTPNKAKLGANAILSVSLACARVAATSKNMPLYRHLMELSGTRKISNTTPLFNVVNGGLHGSGKITIQEFMLIPDPSIPYRKALEMGAVMYQTLKKRLADRKLLTSVGDEGGFTPQFSTNREVLETMKEVIIESGYSYAKDVHIGLDCAASEYYQEGKYKAEPDENAMDLEYYLNYLEQLSGEYKLYLLEDALFEDDWDGWAEITRRIGKTCRVVGDDFLVTNSTRLSKAIKNKACNAVLVKVNQIGTLTETLGVIAMAKKAGYTVIVSHRSGETTDDFIADLAVGTGAQFVKFGAPARGERVAKYNRLLKIYSEITQ